MTPARPRRARLLPSFGTRTAASLTALTLAAAVAVPAALVPEDGPGHREQTVRGTAAGALLAARTDQIRAREWYLNSLRVSRAWKWSKGADITVAVLDTGVDQRHPDLSGRVVAGPDLTGGTRRPGGKYWGKHGTSMASIIAGHGHGAGLQQGVLGIAPQSRILSIRVTWENDDPMRRNGTDLGRSRDAVATGIRYAVDHGAGVINMSLGGGQQFYNGNTVEEKAIRYALDHGVVLIASAGNDGATANRKNFPAAYPGVIAVAALDQKGRVWKDSNRRPYVAVCAPGVDIVSADTGSGYVVGTGTSPSSALVAGVAALIRSRYPKLTPDQVRQALVLGSPARAGRPTGLTNCAGSLDASSALTAAARINRSSHGAVATPKSAAQEQQPKPVAAEPSHGSENLILGILAAGATVVLLSLLMGWRQRGRPSSDDGDDFDGPGGSDGPGEPQAEPARAAHDEETAYETAAHRSGGGTAVATHPPAARIADDPIWQSTDSPTITRRDRLPATGHGDLLPASTPGVTPGDPLPVPPLAGPAPTDDADAVRNVHGEVHATLAERQTPGSGDAAAERDVTSAADGLPTPPAGDARPSGGSAGGPRPPREELPAEDEFSFDDAEWERFRLSAMEPQEAVDTTASAETEVQRSGEQRSGERRAEAQQAEAQEAGDPQAEVQRSGERRTGELQAEEQRAEEMELPAEAVPPDLDPPVTVRLDGSPAAVPPDGPPAGVQLDGPPTAGGRADDPPPAVRPGGPAADLQVDGPPTAVPPGGPAAGGQVEDRPADGVSPVSAPDSGERRAGDGVSAERRDDEDDYRPPWW
ncbi:S8 family serine peptidase [Actinomadura parmotrematis]|uniref:S8 family serine peptidase n=1 Tax=Actinomadura parmotrematis TaxID=2864039 RepID=A0ABS7G3Q4_9ACTN|nr:S8 family serine peptidase [Actinomadura parmotrematis]MBW8487334.1 S8 family serine peptidase [Actinomadura parmotrematis]